MMANVGLSYTEMDKGKKRPRSMNIKVEFDGDWDNQEDHILFRQKIHEQHPEKRIVGYALSDD